MWLAFPRYSPSAAVPSFHFAAKCITLSYSDRRCALATTLVQARVDAELKEEASIVLEAVGLNVSEAIRLMLTRIVAERALPFELLVPNETTIAAIREAREGKLHSAANFDDLLVQLNADD